MAQVNGMSIFATIFCYKRRPNPDKPELKIENCRFVDVARAAQALAPRVVPSFLQSKEYLKY